MARENCTDISCKEPNPTGSRQRDLTGPCEPKHGTPPPQHKEGKEDRETWAKSLMCFAPRLKRLTSFFQPQLLLTWEAWHADLSVSPVSPRQRPSALSLCYYKPEAARLSWISATFTDAWKFQPETCEARYACDYIGAAGRDRGRP